MITSWDWRFTINAEKETVEKRSSAQSQTPKAVASRVGEQQPELSSQPSGDV